MNLYQKSIDILLGNQSASGSFRASPSFDTYRFCWVRDGSFIAHALDQSGHAEQSERFLRWVDTVIRRYAEKVEHVEQCVAQGKRIEKSGFLNARFTLDGFDEKEEGWGNFQLDGYGTWLWALTEHLDVTGGTLEPFRQSVELTVRYIRALWAYPNYDVWEENGDKIHAVTLACLCGGLRAVNRYLKDDGVARLSAQIQTYLLTNCVKDGFFVKYIGSDEADASLLWLSWPFGVVGADDPLFCATVRRMEQELLHHGGMHRYHTDTYYGGGEWVLLSCWMGICYLKSGRRKQAEEILQWVEQSADGSGNLPEQVCTHMNDGSKYDGWVQMWGNPASPLLWSHAMYILFRKEMTK